MAAPLDLDQLRTFLAIAETGSFTRAAETVHRTQSAVSMQMRRLEERIGKPLFAKDGRNNRLTEDGVRLTAYARRLLQLNQDTLAAFDDDQLEGEIRIGMPDDYADRFLPEIMARFARSNPRVELSVQCAPSVNLIEEIRRGQLDLAVVTHTEIVPPNSEIVRREPLLWVGSATRPAHEDDVLALALGRPTCPWRHRATAALEARGRAYRILFTSWSATVVAAAVLSGQAVSVLPECALRPGMRVLGEADGFPDLGDCRIGLLRAPSAHRALADALARHIAESLDNIALPAPAEADALDMAGALPRRGARLHPGHMLAGW